MEQIRDLKERIAQLETRRSEELKSKKRMSSRPNRANSYGKFKEIKSKVNEKYNTMIDALQNEIDVLKCSPGHTVSSDNEQYQRGRKKRRKYNRRQRIKIAMPVNHEVEESSQDEDSVESSFSYIGNKSGYENDSDAESKTSSDEDNKYDSGEECVLRKRSAKQKNQNVTQQEIIEIDSDSSISDDGARAANSSTEDNARAPVDNNDVVSRNPRATSQSSAATAPDSGNLDNTSDEEGDDDVTVEKNMKQYYAPHIKQSKLYMAMQGFRPQSNHNKHTDVEPTVGNKDSAGDHVCFDPANVDFDGKTFYQNRCYTLKDGSDIVGIQRFISEDTAQCIMIAKFCDTILGIEDSRVDYTADFMTDAYVQVFRCNKELSLSDLDKESHEVNEIPRLIYQPQTPGNWNSFGYFFDRTQTKRKGKRNGIRSLELFAGAGGSLQGYHNNGFDTVMAVENDPDAVRTLKENNPSVKTYDGCIKKFLHDYDTLACALGRIDHIHYSSPCQEFSSANRAVANQSVVTGPRERADLSLLLIDFIRKTSCDTAVFENVVGIWRPNNAHYLLNMTKEIMKLGYQVRCTVLHACDYGDPQRRPRVFMFVAKNNVPLPSVPPATHGTSPPLWPYVTVKCALSQVENDNSLPNMEGRMTISKPGQHGHICLDGNDVAPTLRAAAVTPFHFSGDRLLNVREVATLQSFPVRYKFYGGITSQYRQAGNAVPVETSTAVAQSIRQVLLYEYE